MHPISRSSRLAAALLALALVGGLFYALRRSPAPAPREALRQQLVRHGDRMFYGAETNGFTGLMIDRYPGGELLSRSVLRDGLLHGVSEGWYTNGVLQVREHFTNGISHGPRLKFYPEGQKLSEASVVAGKLEGTFRRWHSNGVIADELAMRDNQPHGESRSFHPDGSLKARALAVNGRVTEQTFCPAKSSVTNALSQAR